MKRLLAVLAVVFTLGACAGTAPQSPQQVVFQASQAYVVAAKGANVYLAYPRCTEPSTTVLCSKPDVVAKIKVADNVAFTALTEAQTLVRLPTADQTTLQVAATWANEAIKAFTSVLKVLNLPLEPAK